MPPESDGVTTVGCSLIKLVPDASHLRAIQDAVLSTHRATILATQLLNVHLRRCLVGDAKTDLACFFNGSWLLNAYNAVSVGGGKACVTPELEETKRCHMPHFTPPSRAGIQQCMLYDARHLATVAANNVWMHFQKRVHIYVKCSFAIPDAEYEALSRDAKRERKLWLLQLSTDLCRHPVEAMQSPLECTQWLEQERQWLGIDEAVHEWGDKPLLYHLKSSPHRFVPCMYRMSAACEAMGKAAFSLYPLRRHLVPRHARFDQKALRDLLHLGASEHTKKKQRENRVSKGKKNVADAKETVAMDVSQVVGTASEPLASGSLDGADPTDTGAGGKRKRRGRDEMREEKDQLFAEVVNLRAAGVKRWHRFDFAFTTDGVTARLQMRSNPKTAHKLTTQKLTSVPKRGIWAIDALKGVTRQEQLHVVGVDPGKRELVVCADMDAPRNTAVRYTQKQRLRDLRQRQYTDEARREKPLVVSDAEEELCGFNSRSSDLGTFCAYCYKRQEHLEECLAFYHRLDHRQRRWKRAIKEQQSEQKLYTQLDQLRSDNRQLVLAYGSWGLVAGRSSTACNRGNPPCIGVGLMRKLSRRFLVVPTPEAYTSKTCCHCFGVAGPWVELETERGKKIRGLRRCTQRDCMRVMNRDKMGAVNIGTNFQRLMQGRAPIKAMTQQDLAFHQATVCMECT